MPQTNEYTLNKPLSYSELQEVIEALGGEWCPPSEYHAKPEAQLDYLNGFAMAEIHQPSSLVIHIAGDRADGGIAANQIISEIAKRDFQATLLTN